MKRSQFLRSLKKHCKAHNTFFDWNARKGKGSHGTVYVGDRKTIVKDGELPKDYVGVVLEQLGLSKDAI